MKIRHILRGLAAAALAAWALQAGAQTPPKWSPPTVYNMQNRYYNTSVNCPAWSGGSADYNAKRSTYAEFMCTGIILRATSPDKEPNGAWVPEAKDLDNSDYVSAGGTSFSYLRADATFYRLAFRYTNGFTLYPLAGKYAKPADKDGYTVLCAFVVDGGTDGRRVGGCAEQYNYNAGMTNVAGGPVGDFCQNQGVTRTIPSGATEEVVRDAARQIAADWYDKTYAYKNNLDGAHRGYDTACGFDMTDAPVTVGHTGAQTPGKRGVADFTAMLVDMGPTYRLSDAGTDVNELRIKTWGADAATAAKLPIESFFYITGTDGLTGAQFDQKLYYQTTGQFVPIVAITMAAAVGQDFSFAYHSKDQAVQPTDAYMQAFPTHPTCTRGDFDKKC
jgi:hypothetical protein